MNYPDGFDELVRLVHKSPLPFVMGNELWNKFCRVVFIGKDRSDAEISFLLVMLKPYLDYDKLLKTDGEEWQEHVKTFIRDRMLRIQDVEIRQLLADLLKDLFSITASLKGGARFFEKNKIAATIDERTSTKEKTFVFVESLVNDADVSGIRYAKAILWLQSTGRAKDLAPPTWQLKSFLNSDIGPYYQFYEDDQYFMKRAEEMTADFKHIPLVDIYRSIFFYRMLKAPLPRGSKFTPKKLIMFLKKQKLTIAKLASTLADLEEKELLFEKLLTFLGYSAGRTDHS
ncbi:MAG: hypothetical protein HY832_01070 [Candidatus Aenigmarchaeota archaeon]|nr:hypothetical protein [Candidatus Aenigmarchaeota archaeon]